MVSELQSARRKLRQARAAWDVRSSYHNLMELMRAEAEYEKRWKSASVAERNELLQKG